MIATNNQGLGEGVQYLVGVDTRWDLQKVGRDRHSALAKVVLISWRRRGVANYKGHQTLKRPHKLHHLRKCLNILLP